MQEEQNNQGPKGTTMLCVNINPLEGNTIAPPLTKDADYPILNVHTCPCGQEHYDVGIKSQVNYVRCYKCSEELVDGDKIHWCHPSRFVAKA